MADAAPELPSVEMLRALGINHRQWLMMRIDNGDLSAIPGYLQSARKEFDALNDRHLIRNQD